MYTHMIRWKNRNVYRERGSLWVVYIDDGEHGVSVMRDPERLDYTCREMLEELGWIERE